MVIDGPGCEPVEHQRRPGQPAPPDRREPGLHIRDNQRTEHRQRECRRRWWGGIDVGDTTSGSTTSNVDLTLDSVDVSHNTAFDGGGIDENGLSDDPVYFCGHKFDHLEQHRRIPGRRHLCCLKRQHHGRQLHDRGQHSGELRRDLRRGTGTLGAVLTNVTLATNNALTGARGCLGKGRPNFSLTLENTIATDGSPVPRGDPSWRQPGFLATPSGPAPGQRRADPDHGPLAHQPGH